MKVNRYVFCFVFDSSGKVLVIRRAGFMRARPHEWDLPGGKLEVDEDYESGLMREVFEETGLKISSAELISRGSGIWKGGHHEFSYYRSNTVGKDVILSEEHTEYSWHEALVAATMITYRPHLFGFGLVAKHI